jgi:uncharacterized protein
MITSRTICALLAATLLPAGAPKAPAQGLVISPEGVRVSKRVRSLGELRQSNLVHQKWDLSCGAAVLSTVLTYDLNTPTSESQVVVWILRRTNPVRVQSRGGFSLLDLKKYSKAHGFNAEGYGNLTLTELIELGRPAIVPIRIKGFNHFVIFRGATFRGEVVDRVVIADPVYGNLTMPVQHFQEIWKGGIGFVVLPRFSTAPNALYPKRSELAIPDSSVVFRGVLDAGIGTPTRPSP